MCRDVAGGPVWAARPPPAAATIRSGLSKAAPQACDSTYPNSPPSWIEPGVSGVQWLPIPPGNENCLKNSRRPRMSSPGLGHENHVQIELLEQPAEVDLDARQVRPRSPMAQRASRDICLLYRL